MENNQVQLPLSPELQQSLQFLNILLNDLMGL